MESTTRRATDAHERGQVNASAAEIYDELFVPALFAEWPARVLDAAGLSATDRLLDVACGTGVLARAARERARDVVGVDINEGMLAVARREPAIEWVQAAAEQLPFEDASFDVVASQFGLMFFVDRAKALREMCRLVKPGGSLAVAVWSTLDETPGYAAMASLLGRLFGRAAAESLEAPYSLGDPDVLRRAFADAGMEDLTVELVDGTARFPSLERWVHVDIRGWTLADQIDDDGVARLLEAAETELARFVQPDGSVAFAAPALIAVHER